MFTITVGEIFRKIPRNVATEEENTFKSVKPHNVQLNSVRLTSKSVKQISQLAQGLSSWCYARG